MDPGKAFFAMPKVLKIKFACKPLLGQKKKKMENFAGFQIIIHKI